MIIIIGWGVGHGRGGIGLCYTEYLYIVRRVSIDLSIENKY